MKNSEKNVDDSVTKFTRVEDMRDEESDDEHDENEENEDADHDEVASLYGIHEFICVTP